MNKRLPLLLLPDVALHNVFGRLGPVEYTRLAATCTDTRLVPKVQNTTDDINTIKGAMNNASTPCPTELILKYRPFAKGVFKDQLDDYIQSYINTNLPEEKETLFDKLREEPRSNEAKAAHTQYITTRLTDHPLLVFATNKYGNTPLHLAAYEGHTAIAKALIDAGANMTATDEDGCTPLHYAACEGKLKTVQALLKAGSNPDTTNNEGYTPLHLAVIKGSRATVDGWTPRQLATNHAIKALLHKAGA